MPLTSANLDTYQRVRAALYYAASLPDGRLSALLADPAVDDAERRGIEAVAGLRDVARAGEWPWTEVDQWQT